MAWGDYDDDGYVDVFLNNHNLTPAFLLHNNGTAFTDVAFVANVAEVNDQHSCRWGDFDIDGNLDLYCSTGADMGTSTANANLWRNNGDGTFDDVAVAVGVGFSSGRGRSANWIDIDNDADLDLFVGTDSDNSSQPVATLFRNDGGVFAIANDQLDTEFRQESIYSLVFDYQQDNDWDLLVRLTSSKEAPGWSGPCTRCLVVLQNDGAGQFTTILGTAIGLNSSHWGPISMGDFDNDGDIDVFTARDSAAQNQYFRNAGNGIFQQVSLESVGLSGIRGTDQVRKISWADFDNNGHLDLYIVRRDGGTNTPNELFLNNGNGTFEDASFSANATGPTNGVGDTAAVADFNNDGFVDLIIGNGLGQNRGPYTLLRNEKTGNRWIRIVPRSANGSPRLGVKVYIETANGKQYREFVDQSGMRGADELVAHFGVGTELTVSSVRVEWPNGVITEMQGVATNMEIDIVDPGAAGSNLPPIVNAGSDQQIVLPFDTANLDGTVSDDGLPGGSLTTQWSLVDGPAGVAFGDFQASDTTVQFTVAGVYELSLSADDGELSGADTLFVTVLAEPDGEMPTVSISAPLGGVTVSGVQLIEAQAADNVAVSEVTFAVDGVMLGAVMSPPYEWSWDSATVDNGTHTITALATDSSENIANAMISVEVQNNQAPLVQITSPGDGDIVTITETINLEASADDAEEGDVSASLSWESNLAGVLGSGASLTIGPLVAGTHVITASVTDQGGAGATGTDSVIIVVSDPSAKTTASLPAVADAFVRRSSSTLDTNFGGEDFMRVENWGPKASFVQFDVPGLTGTVTSAVLHLPVQQVSNAGMISLHRVLEPWSELTITERNQPAAEAVEIIAFPVQLADAVGFVQIDITSLVAGWQVDPAAAFGFVLRHQADTRISFDTRESANPAFINVTMGAAANAAPVVEAGADQQIALPLDTVNLNGTVSDDGLPGGSLVTQWSLADGPAAVAFGDLQAIDTTAQFTLAGVYELSLTADDGELSSADTLFVTVLPEPDGELPTISIAAPLDGAVVSGMQLIEAQAADNVAVREVTFAVDGVMLGTVTSPPYEWSWDSATVDNGTHTITALATDSSDNIANAMIGVEVQNNQAPLVQITSPADGAVFTITETVNLEASADDADEGDLSTSLTWVSNLAGSLGSGASLSIGPLVAGTHVITASATDQGGAGATGADSVTIIVSDPGATTTATLPAVADAFVRRTSATLDTNYGNANLMRVENWGPKAGFVQFDISDLTRTVTSAVLHLPVQEVSNAGTISLHRVLEPWSELTITERNQPPVEAVEIVAVPVQLADSGGFVQVDITSLVADWQSNPATAYGFVLRHQADSRISLDTRESANPAFIDITMNNAN